MWQNHREIIELFATLWPKAFSVRQRRPLKLAIERDIKPHEVALAAGHPVDVDAAVAYYCNSIWYVETLLAGAQRVDLNGERVGTVTPAEATAAALQAVGIRKAMAAKRAQEQQQLTPVGRVLQSIPGVADDQFRKVPAPPAARPRGEELAPVGRPSRNAERNRELARRYASGETSTVLARELGLTPKSIRDSVVAAGGVLRAAGGRPRKHMEARAHIGRPRKHVTPETKEASVTVTATIGSY